VSAKQVRTNDRLCVVCAHSAAPLDTLYPPSRKQPFVLLSLSLSPSLLYMYLSLSCSRCLPTFFPLWRIELFCCALLYILPAVYIFLGPDNRYMSAAVFLADTSLSQLLLNGAIQHVHKRMTFWYQCGSNWRCTCLDWTFWCDVLNHCRINSTTVSCTSTVYFSLAENDEKK